MQGGGDIRCRWIEQLREANIGDMGQPEGSQSQQEVKDSYSYKQRQSR